MGSGFSPLTERLALVPGTLSPALAELAVQFGTELPFARASALLALATGTVVSEATIRRLTEQAGATWAQLELALVEALETVALDPDAAPVVVPDVVAVPAGTMVQVSVDGAMVPLVGGEWTEARTMAIGYVGRNGEDVRTTALSYASHVATAETFIRLAQAEVTRRGVATAPVVTVNDGAMWIQEFLDWTCPHAIRVLDFPHAAGYLAQAAQASFGPGTAETSEWFACQRHALRHGDPDQVLAALTALPPSEARDTALGYLTARRAMLDYAAFSAAGLPVGSGCVESANKLVIEARLKRSGMHWTRDHADAMVALRAVVASDRWDTVWPRIVAAMHTARRHRTIQRRQARAVPEPAPSRPRRPKLIVDGKPTALHPWKALPACASRARTIRITKT